MHRGCSSASAAQNNKSPTIARHCIRHAAQSLPIHIHVVGSASLGCLEVLLLHRKLKSDAGSGDEFWLVRSSLTRQASTIGCHAPTPSEKGRKDTSEAAARHLRGSSGRRRGGCTCQGRPTVAQPRHRQTPVTRAAIALSHLLLQTTIIDKSRLLLHTSQESAKKKSPAPARPSPLPAASFVYLIEACFPYKTCQNVPEHLGCSPDNI